MTPSSRQAGMSTSQFTLNQQRRDFDTADSQKLNMSSRAGMTVDKDGEGHRQRSEAERNEQGFEVGRPQRETRFAPQRPDLFAFRSQQGHRCWSGCPGGQSFVPWSLIPAMVAPHSMEIWRIYGHFWQSASQNRDRAVANQCAVDDFEIVSDLLKLTIDNV